MSLVRAVPAPPVRKAPALLGALSAAIPILVLAACWSAWRGMIAVGGITRALWILPALIALHLGQLLLAGLAWRSLFEGARPPFAAFARLRIIREGIDSLLPVAQVGGEVVGARLLARLGVPQGQAAASVIVDVTIELLTQLLFLLAGLVALAMVSRTAPWRTLCEALLAGGLAAAGLLVAQRFGVLRALETLARAIAARWPSLPAAALDGLQAETLAFYRVRRTMRCVLLHALGWSLGTIESWAVLHRLGQAVSPGQALAVESLGMAARSAGFAIPGALGVQEGGFVLAGLAVGLPLAPSLALSLVKRVREIAVGMIGLVLWRWAARRGGP